MGRRLGGSISLLALLSSWLGCASKFDGPYACMPGYASCDSSQSCETNIASDGANCGACGNACEVGAPCVDSACGSAATTVYDFQSAGYAPSQLAVNSTALFWTAQNSASGIHRYPFSGGAVQIIAPSGSGTSFQTQCSGFAVDDDYVYVFGSSYGSGTSWSGLARVSLASGAVDELAPTSSQAVGGTCPQAMALSGGYVYAFVSQPGSGVGVQIWRAPADGTGPLAMVFSQPGGNNVSSQFVVSGQEIVLEQPNTSGSGAGALDVVPVSGGQPTTLATNGSNGGYGLEAFTADPSHAYTAGTSCPCFTSGDQPTYSGPPTGGVALVPLDGGQGTNLAAITGYVGAMAVDASSAYVLTDSTLWKVPLAGGAAVAIAGNLTGGTAPTNCQSSYCGNGDNGSGNLPQAGDLVVASDAVYFFDRSPSVYSILKVAK